MSLSKARERLGFAQDELLFLFFGRIQPYKGVFDLIDAFEQLENPHARLLLVGKPESNEAQALLESRGRSHENIHLYLDYVANTDIQLYMNAADLVVLPFREILTSSTVILAMSFGKAVIAPRVGCIAETLADQGCFFYNANERNGLLQALQKAQSADLAAMGRSNLQQADRFNWNEIGRQTHEVYRQCLLKNPQYEDSTR
ncbi:glycosyltransferase family 4 protein [Chloroflexi bacterium TSY]|nr:glycosyltransferase family 4 protein [Chloroflexi bacterium TSY]MBV7338715.1 glycosyltransferase family 4 protein [Chloroflexi bacterium TSY]